MNNFTLFSKSSFFIFNWPILVMAILFFTPTILKNNLLVEEDVVVGFKTQACGSNDWLDNACWCGGTSPGTNPSANVTIVTEIDYPNTADLTMTHTLRIEGPMGKVNVPEGRSWEFSSNGRFEMFDAEILWGGAPSGSSGNLVFDGNATARLDQAKVTVGGNWDSVSSGTSREFIGGCLISLNGNFANQGMDEYSGVCMELINGNWINEGTVTVGGIRNGSQMWKWRI